MPMKPTEHGFKIWCLCDSTNGFTYQIEMYTGAGSTTPNVNGLGPSVVLNHERSVPTTRTNCKGWPQQLKDTKHLDKTLTRGIHRYIVVDDGRTIK